MSGVEAVQYETDIVVPPELVMRPKQRLIPINVIQQRILPTSAGATFNPLGQIVFNLSNHDLLYTPSLTLHMRIRNTSGDEAQLDRTGQCVVNRTTLRIGSNIIPQNPCQNTNVLWNNLFDLGGAYSVMEVLAGGKDPTSTYLFLTGITSGGTSVICWGLSDTSAVAAVSTAAQYATLPVPDPTRRDGQIIADNSYTYVALKLISPIGLELKDAQCFPLLSCSAMPQLTVYLESDTLALMGAGTDSPRFQVDQVVLTYDAYLLDGALEAYLKAMWGPAFELSAESWGYDSAVLSNASATANNLVSVHKTSLKYILKDYRITANLTTANCYSLSGFSWNQQQYMDYNLNGRIFPASRMTSYDSTANVNNNGLTAEPLSYLQQVFGNDNSVDKSMPRMSRSLMAIINGTATTTATNGSYKDVVNFDSALGNNSQYSESGVNCQGFEIFHQAWFGGAISNQTNIDHFFKYDYRIVFENGLCYSRE